MSKRAMPLKAIITALTATLPAAASHATPAAPTPRSQPFFLNAAANTAGSPVYSKSRFMLKDSVMIGQTTQNTQKGTGKKTGTKNSKASNNAAATSTTTTTKKKGNKKTNPNYSRSSTGF